MDPMELKETLKPAKRPRLEVESGREGEEEDNDEDERLTVDLEMEVKEMAEKVLDFRRTIPERLADVVSSGCLALLRSNLPHELQAVVSQPTTAETSALPVTKQQQSDCPGNLLFANAEERDLEKLNVFRDKAMSNITAAPLILKRVNECLARINKIEEYKVNIHPAFKSKTN